MHFLCASHKSGCYSKSRPQSVCIASEGLEFCQSATKSLKSYHIKPIIINVYHVRNESQRDQQSVDRKIRPVNHRSFFLVTTGCQTSPQSADKSSSQYDALQRNQEQFRSLARFTTPEVQTALNRKTQLQSHMHCGGQ